MLPLLVSSVRLCSPARVSPSGGRRSDPGIFRRGPGKAFLEFRKAGEKGRFRSFLLVCLKRHLTASVRRQFALKRGSGRTSLAIESTAAQRRWNSKYADHETPERAYERRWALSLIEHALGELRDQSHADGHGHIFDMLQGQLVPGPERASARDAATSLGLSESGARVTLHRLRRRFREILRHEIACTVASPDEVDAEVDCIFRILSR